MDYFLQHCSGIIEQQGNIFLSLFLGGLLGSLNHCVGMCSPFVLMQIASNQAPISFLQKIYGGALVAYHTGRITTYIVLAFVTSVFSLQIVGGIWGQFFIAVLLAFAGILFIINAIPSLSLRGGQGVSLFDMSGIFARLINPLLRTSHFISRYLLGIVLGFLPCGLVFAALMVTTTMNHAGIAALGMACFGLGTVPALFCVALFGQTLMKKWQHNLKKLSHIMLILNGLFLVFMAYKKIMIIL